MGDLPKIRIVEHSNGYINIKFPSRHGGVYITKAEFKALEDVLQRIPKATEAGSQQDSGRTPSPAKASRNIKENKDGTISPIDPTKPSYYSTQQGDKNNIEDPERTLLNLAVAVLKLTPDDDDNVNLNQPVQESLARLTTYVEAEKLKAIKEVLIGIVERAVFNHTSVSIEIDDYLKRIAEIEKGQK